MNKLLLIIPLLLAGCAKDQHMRVEYRASGNKYALEYTDPAGNTIREVVYRDWSRTLVFEAGDRISMHACTIPFDSAFVHDSDGKVIDTLYTPIYNAGVSLSAFKVGDNLAIKSGGVDPGGSCGGFEATVPKQ